MCVCDEFGVHKSICVCERVDKESERGAHGHCVL